MPESLPEFIGGPDAFRRFCQKKYRVSTRCKKRKGIQGKVYIQFVVEKDGTVTNEVVRRGVNPLLDTEALRVAKLLPAFKPGTMRGKKVRVRYTLPMVTSLSA